MITKNVFKTGAGVKVSFSGAITKESVEKMVENCATGQCDCMSDASKEKVKDMKVSGVDGEVSIDMIGDTLTQKEIEEAVSRSKVINTDDSSCC